MVLDDGLAHGMARALARGIADNVGKLITRRNARCPTKRAAKFRFVVKRIQEMSAIGYIEDTFYGDVTGKDKDAYYICTHYATKEDKTICIMLSLVEARDPSEANATTVLTVSNHAIARLLQTFKLSLPETMLLLSPFINIIINSYHENNVGTFAMLHKDGVVIFEWGERFEIKTAIATQAMTTGKREFVENNAGTIVEWK